MHELSADFDIEDVLLSAAAERHLQVHNRRLRADLMSRVHASATAHKEYTTIRHKDRMWQEAGPGAKVQSLRNTAHFKVDFWSLEPGTSLTWPNGAMALEILITEGGLGAASAEGTLSAQICSYILCEKPAECSQWIAQVRTVLYVRQRLAPIEHLDPVEAHWWRLASVQQGLARPRRWVSTSPGVEVMKLCGDQQVVTMLVRFAVGASVADHRHSIDEDCLVLQGEMFLGDVLLRQSDYQLAPAGGSHFGEMSDVGVTFYLHGGLDPVLL